MTTPTHELEIEKQSPVQKLKDFLSQVHASDRENKYVPYISELLVETCKQYEEARKGNSDLPPLVLSAKDRESIPEETRSMFADAHNYIYTPYVEEIVAEVLKGAHGVSYFEILSCMFGGKTTLVLRVKEELEENGLKVDVYISNVMGEDKLTARGGRLGNFEVEAKPFGGYKSKKERSEAIEGILEEGNGDVIILDEFSFLHNPEDVLQLLIEADSRGKKVILLGLNTNYLGKKLPLLEHPPYREVMHGRRSKGRPVYCRAFTAPSQVIEMKPKGVGTIRYINIGTKENPYYILDLGLGNLVISKTMEYIHYCPANAVLAEALGNMPSFARILEGTANQEEDFVSTQKAITEHIERISLRD